MCSYLLLNNSRWSGFIRLTVCNWKSFNLAKLKLLVVKFLKIGILTDITEKEEEGRGRDTHDRLGDGSGHDWDMGTARLQALLWQTQDARTQAASHETARPLIMSTSLCFSQSLSWKILTSEIMMIYMWNSNFLSDPNLYLYSTEYAITKTQRKEENTNTHTHMYLYVSV